MDGKAKLSAKAIATVWGMPSRMPDGAITIEEREAEPFDEEAVKNILLRKLPNQPRLLPAGRKAAVINKDAAPADTPIDSPRRWDNGLASSNSFLKRPLFQRCQAAYRRGLHCFCLRQYTQ